MKHLLLLLVITLSSLFAQGENGTLTVLVMKDGKPLKNAEIMIDGGDDLYRTDEDGSVYAVLSEGRHRLELVANDQGEIIAYAKESFLVRGGKNTQVIISLKYNGLVDNVDKESPVADEVVEKSEDKTLAYGDVVIKVVSSEDKNPLTNARIFVKGTSIDARTSQAGEAKINLSEGEHTLSIIHSDFSSQTVKVTVKPNQTLSSVYELTPASVELEEFVVLAPFVTGTVASSIQAEKEDDAVVDILGSEQMTKSGDSKASDAIRRVSGVTIIDGKYVFVRGLGPRYNLVQMNNFYMPSPNPFERSVPLDIFPTGVLDSIEVQKTFTPDKPADFAGAIVNLKTKTVPDEFFFNIDVAGKYNTSSTFKKGNTYHGGSTDWLGYGDNARALPSGVDGAGTLKEGTDSGEYTPDQITALSKEMSYNNDTFTKEMPPGFKVGVSIGDSFELTDATRLGFYASASYKNENDTTNIEKNVFGLDGGTQKRIYGGNYDVTEDEYLVSGMFGMGLELNKNHKISWTNLYLHQANNYTTLFEGTDENRPYVRTMLTWMENEILTSQLSGEHTIDALNGFKVDWRGGISHASMQEPDMRSYQFDYDEDTEEYELTRSATKVLNREWNKLDDDNYELALDLTQPFSFYFDKDSYVKAGVDYMNSKRTYKNKQYYMARTTSTFPELEYGTNIDDMINDSTIGYETTTPPGYFRLKGLASNVGNYDGLQELTAFYVMSNMQAFRWWVINFGVRNESSTQEIKTFNNFTGEAYPAGDANLKTNDWLPELSFVFKFSDDSQLRAIYGKTLSRPNFKELSPATTINPNTGDLFRGNPDLERTLIDNYDLRWEYYISATELFSLAGFYKNFDNPIEQIIEAGSDKDVFTYANANSASVYGAEVDLRKNFGDWSFADLTNFYFAGNAAYIVSKVDVGEGSISNGGIMTNESREMEGTSPYIINAQLGYDNLESGTSLAFVYNIFGKRIVTVGTHGLPDQYEEPVNRLNFVGIYELFENFRVNFRVKNILDPDFTIKQGDQVAYQWKEGTEFELGISYKY